MSFQLNDPSLTPGDLSHSAAAVYPHIINGSVAEYVVRDAGGKRVATFTATDAGFRRAADLVHEMNCRPAA